MLLLDIIAGARPKLMKIAQIIHAIEESKFSGGSLEYRLIHTGQHYGARMSGDFFIQLGIPEPDVNLEVDSGTQAEQKSAIMVRYAKLLLASSRSDLYLVVGDVSSTMACAIIAKNFTYRLHMWRVEFDPVTGPCRRRSIGWLPTQLQTGFLRPASKKTRTSETQE
jgi:UDP-N-acetylglucosamine 2-epimerase